METDLLDEQTLGSGTSHGYLVKKTFVFTAGTRFGEFCNDKLKTLKIGIPSELKICQHNSKRYFLYFFLQISDPSNLSVVEHLTSVSQLAYLDLSSVQISQQTLGLVLRMSPNLVKLSLEHLTVSKTVIESMMSFAKTIEVLNLAMCYELDAKALTKFFSSCPRYLKLFSLKVSCYLNVFGNLDSV